MCLEFKKRNRRKLLKIRAKNVPVLCWKVVVKELDEFKSPIWMKEKYKYSSDLVLGSKYTVKSNRRSLDKDGEDYSETRYDHINIYRGIYCFSSYSDASEYIRSNYNYISGMVIVPVIGMSEDMVGFNILGPGGVVVFTKVLMAKRLSDTGKVNKLIDKIDKYSFKKNSKNILWLEFSKVREEEIPVFD